MANGADGSGRRKRVFFRVLAMGLGVGIALAVLFAIWPREELQRVLTGRNSGPLYLQEPGHTVTGHRYVYDSVLGWRNIPNWQSKTFGRKLTINSKGLRDREYPYAKPAGTKRILVLGDSYVWGYGVADDEIFTEVLERSITEKNGKYEVINTGVSGWGTDQEYLFLINEGFRYAPDIVILAFFFVNDPANNIMSSQYGLAKPMFLNRKLELAEQPVPKPGASEVILKSPLEPIDMTCTIIEHIADYCSELKCSFVVMKFGTFLFPNDPNLMKWERETEERLATHQNITYLDLDESFVAAGITAYQLLHGNNDGHWNAAGHRETAIILYHFLIDKALIKIDGE